MGTPLFERRPKTGREGESLGWPGPEFGAFRSAPLSWDRTRERRAPAGACQGGAVWRLGLSPTRPPARSHNVPRTWFQIGSAPLWLMPMVSTPPSPLPDSTAAEAIPALLDLHGPKLHALAMRLCGHRADATTWCKRSSSGRSAGGTPSRVRPIRGRGSTRWRPDRARSGRGARAGSIGVRQADPCARCRAVFRELDLVQDACTHMGDGPMPTRLLGGMAKAMRQRDEAGRSGAATPRRGRRPVATSATRTGRGARSRRR